MKSLRVAALGLFLVLCAAPAHGDSIPAGDPKIKQGGGDPPSPTYITSASFYIESPTGTSPASLPGGSACDLFQSFFGQPPQMTNIVPSCVFANGITENSVGQDITRLVFDILNVSPSSVTCGLINEVDFRNCSVAPFDDGGTMVTFSHGSIPFQSDFSLQFTGFPPDTDFGCSPISTCPQNAGTSAVPEPGTLVLFLGGIGALLIGRRLRA